MDRITESLLTEFSQENGVAALSESKRFEHFCCFVTVRKHHSDHFDAEDVVCGDGSAQLAHGGDTGIDGIAIIVNGSLVTDIENLDDYAERSNSLEVQFVFVQAETSSGFDGAKINSFAFGVADFFKEKPALKRNEAIANAAEIMAAIYSRSTKFNRGNPSCRLYYVTTGKWVDDPNLVARLKAGEADLASTGLFSSVSYSAIGADEAQKLYRQTKNAVSKTFTFSNRTVIPDIPGISQAFLGFLSAHEFTDLIRDDDGDIRERPEFR